jgi:formylglycine-generating enzyme required for sulfatase activity
MVRTGLMLTLLISTGMHAQQLKTFEQKIPGSDVSFKMVAIPAGTFEIGSNAILSDTDERPPKQIAISGFWMSEHEVTFEEWDQYFKDSSIPQSKELDGVTRATPQYIDLTWGMGRDAKHPANSMSHSAALMYCRWLYIKTGIFYRLPTEAEWEYACKAGTDAVNPKVLTDLAIYKSNSDNKFQPVKTKQANAWGLYDMLGNLSEWTLDQYDPLYYQKIAGKDPATAPMSRHPKTVRGGSYLDESTVLRCANRIPSDPKWNQRDPQVPKSRWWLTDGMFVGFRVVRPAVQPGKVEVERFFELWLK